MRFLLLESKSLAKEEIMSEKYVLATIMPGGGGGGPFAWMKNHFYPMDVYVVSSSRRSTVCTVAKSEETAMKYDIVVTLK